MASVWYVGTSNRRVISSSDWEAAGVTGSGDFTWDATNGYSQPATAFNAQQLAWLDAASSEFLYPAPDGPRTALVYSTDSFVTLNQLRDFLASYTFSGASGLTKASVGLSNVDNTSDVSKPVSTAVSQALAKKADYPAGGTDGQVLVKSGSTTAWVQPSQAGGNQGSFAVTQVADPDSPSGYAYRVTGSGVAQTTDPDSPSGLAYSIN